mmetsp:Transcript_2717/g.10939  ORF Transcript_2717/g.10939 Transcript_2717/m.10939 type:complete len:202 (+) Transcript_2717:11140-11745(+)
MSSAQPQAVAPWRQHRRGPPRARVGSVCRNLCPRLDRGRRGHDSAPPARGRARRRSAERADQVGLQHDARRPEWANGSREPGGRRRGQAGHGWLGQHNDRGARGHGGAGRMEKLRRRWAGRNGGRGGCCVVLPRRLYRGTLVSRRVERLLDDERVDAVDDVSLWHGKERRESAANRPSVDAVADQASLAGRVCSRDAGRGG